MEGQVFSMMTDLVSPLFLWAGFLLVAIFTTIASLILLYHWYRFNTSRQMVITAGIVYLSGVVILSLMIITSIIIFTVTS